MEGVLMTTIEAPFEQLPLARTSIPAALIGLYRIYTDNKNFKLVQADSAVTALETSGLLEAFKIEREAIHKNTLIAPNFAQAAVAVTSDSIVP
jgi:hypothetical protein